MEQTPDLSWIEPRTPHDLWARGFLERLSVWAEARADVRAVIVVGSFARGEARADSDLDVLLLAENPDDYLHDSGWVSALGEVVHVVVERYGRVTSLRARLDGGLEVELGIAPADWASRPYDAGTLQVARGKVRVLFDRQGDVTALAAASFDGSLVTGPRLETERLLLRWITLDDLNAFFELASNPRIIRYVGNQPLASLEDARQTLVAAPLTDYATYGYGRLACVWKQTGQVVGFCGPKFLSDEQEVDLGYRFLPDFWGIGLATESSVAVVEYARSQLGLRRLVGWVHPDNVASARVLTKLGFSFERKTTVPSLPDVTFDLYAKLLEFLRPVA